MKRSCASLVFAATLLAGCASYSDMHPQSTVLQVAAAKPNAAFVVDAAWWKIFGDRQLDALIDESLRSSPDIRTAQARVRLAEHEAALAGASLNASYSINGSATRQLISAKGYFPPPLGGSIVNLGQISTDFDYDFDWWGKHHAVLKASLNELAASEAEEAEARLILGTSIARTYFRLQFNMRKHEIADRIVKARNALAHISRVRAEGGLDSDYRADTDEGAVAAANLDQSVLDEQIKLDRIRIAALLGRVPDKAVDIRMQSPRIPSLPRSIPADLVGMRPDIQAQRMRIEAASSLADEAKAEFYPDINLAASVGFDAIGFGNLLDRQSLTYSFGPAIHLPIFSSGSLRARLGTRIADYDISVEEYNRMVVDAMRDVTMAAASMRAADLQASDQDRVISRLTRAYRIAQVRYEGGLGDRASVLESEIPLLSQQQVRAGLDERQIESVLQMIRSLGGAPGTHTE